jgi:hypothetical protein
MLVIGHSYHLKAQSPSPEIQNRPDYGDAGDDKPAQPPIDPNCKAKMDSMNKVIDSLMKIPDSANKMFAFELGTNFNFLSSSPSFSNYIYGGVRYLDNNLINISRKKDNYKRWHLGLEMAANYTTSQDYAFSNLYSTNLVNPTTINKGVDSVKFVNEVVSNKLDIYINQYSFSINPNFLWNVTKKGNIKLGFGIYAEMYRVNYSFNYSNQKLIDSISTVVTLDSFNKSKNVLQDTFSSATTYGYYGISIPFIVNESWINVRFKMVYGLMVLGQDPLNLNPYNVTSINIPKQQNGSGFYLFDITLTEPHYNLSIQANIRGTFPREVPTYNIIIMKKFNMQNFFKNIANLVTQ